MTKVFAFAFRALAKKVEREKAKESKKENYEGQEYYEIE